jgi:hypothetical protein
MSNIILNRGNVDVTDLEIEQAGNNACEIMTEQPLLDSTKDYVMGVTSCVVPVTEEPMITYDISSRQLFTIRVRKHGAGPNNAASQLAFIGHAVASAGKESCSLEEGYKIFSITDLVTFVANWTAIVSNAISDMGLSLDGAGNTVNCNEAIARNHPTIDRRVGGNTGRRLLGVSLTPGGTLKLVGSPIFWNNFYIITNSYCREILGFQPIISVSYNNNQVNSLPQNVIAGVPETILVATPLPATHPDQDVNADYTIFRKTEERMLISMEVDLTVPMNLSIVNGLETRTHTVFSAPLQSEIISTVTAGNGIIYDSTNLTMTALQGRVHLLKKTNGNVQWYPLKSSYMIQNSRCSLYITRRRWSMRNDMWYTDRQPVKIAKDGVWNASIKFVSVF